MIVTLTPILRTDEEAGTGAPPAPDQSHVTNQSAVAASVDNPLEETLPTPDYPDTPVDVEATLGKRVYALSPEQYEQMRTTNDAIKAGWRDKIINDQKNDEYGYIYTKERYPEVEYPDFPKLRPGLQTWYEAPRDDMQCTDYTLKRLAGFWPEGNNKC